MGARREDVDLELVLRDPACARQFIADYDWAPLPAQRYVVFGIDGKIWFDNMTDEEAVMAALIILEEFERPKVLKVKRMLEDFGIH